MHSGIAVLKAEIVKGGISQDSPQIKNAFNFIVLSLYAFKT